MTVLAWLGDHTPGRFGNWLLRTFSPREEEPWVDAEGRMYPPLLTGHPKEAQMPDEVCPDCQGDGYTETWNDDQTGVITEICSWCNGTGFAAAPEGGET